MIIEDFCESLILPYVQIDPYQKIPRVFCCKVIRVVQAITEVCQILETPQ